jgi:hypothetical protein
MSTGVAASVFGWIRRPQWIDEKDRRPDALSRFR